MTDDQLCVPMDLRTRFLPLEHATFDLIKQAGVVRLWRSTSLALASQLHGERVQGHIRFHITVRDEAAALLIKSEQEAQDVFHAIRSHEAFHG